MTLKVLNLYAGIGGNRKLWKDVEVTAIENNPEIARIYKENFPNDCVIVCDAHRFLLACYDSFDFIWSSPPCPTHSRVRFMASKSGSYPIEFPDLKLYEEIIFLKHFFKGRWVVENVISYYEPLIKPYIASRHYFWANFFIDNKCVEQRNHNKVTGLTKIYGFDLTKYKLEHRKDQIIRNMVHPNLGLYVFNCAFKTKQMKLL